MYHDLGNVNYSLHRDKSLFNRTAAAEMIIKAFKEHADNLFISPRHDIFIKTQDGSSAKVSGSAYKLTRDRAYHHGTLLLSTDLQKIGTLLKSPVAVLKDDTFKFGGVSSFPSPVANIPNLSFDLALELISKEFDPTEPLIEISSSNPQIDEYAKELGSREWTFGKSPPFKTKTIDGTQILIEAGIIRESSDASLIGCKFEQELANTHDNPKY